jgi:hypothetical protein
MSRLRAQVILLERRNGNTLKSDLYFISDREVKAGDKCYNLYDGGVWVYRPAPCPMPYWGNPKTLKKIEATTNEELGLPLIGKAFLEAYEKSQASINYVRLDYHFSTVEGEVHYDKRTYMLRYSDTGESYHGEVDLNNVELTLKPDNTVVTSKDTEQILKAIDLQTGTIHTVVFIDYDEKRQFNVTLDSEEYGRCSARIENLRLYLEEK